ncbi:DNA-binding transcriptional regulator, CsgD family [Ruegeria halocynthiae]|uniref:DNA-binding transcriptional regulator, CsgD family n=1 Tax=Ruegeria halocynthiae TaxID=985054 RepID=A0A1H3F6T3_9RHOB|nr:autoinducer binding domain-containing protein [Ruegeria halocynthiae]SDX86058.1 DNA-binding transcriptional regulator, CsgD family [Ruegeria halocynthiae]
MKIADIGNSELDFRQTGEARLQEICQRFGLENASYAHIDKHHNVVHGCTTFPEEWVRYYVDNDLVLADPLIRFGATMIAPIDWSAFDNQTDYAALFQAARKFGVGRNGLSIPVINPFGERGVFTVTSKSPRPEWDALIAKMLPALRHEAQVLHLLALDVIETVFNFPSDSLSGDELDVLKMLASGLIPSVIARQTGHASRTVDALTASITTKLKSRTIEQAVARAVSTGFLKWTDFFADPVAELADAERGVLSGGIVRWGGRSYEFIAFEEGRTVRNLESFHAVQVENLAREYNLDINEVLEAIGANKKQVVWIRRI